ncbi:MAG: MFS transporter [Propionibacteriaceae bacterium]|jgi:MFS family permease|nr:MFS transporter [Propionibacteriaceae bacterium]
MKNHYAVRLPGVDRVFDRRKILIINMVPLAMALLQISAVNVALPSITQSLGAQSHDIQLVLSGYALAFGICLVPFGRVGDVLGRSSLFTIGLAIFTISCLVCGLATSPLALNIARVFQGLGAGMQGPQTTGMIQQYFKGQGRARAYSLQGMTVAAAVALGPLMSGIPITLLGPDLGWRTSFLVNFPLGVAGVIVACFWLPFDTEREAIRARKLNSGRKRRKLDLDPVGALLLTVAVVCVMVPFMFGSENPRLFWLLLAAAALAGAWMWWEVSYHRRGHEPMVNPELFRLRSFIHHTLISAVDFLGITSIFVIVAMFLQQGLGWDALQASLIGLPNAVVTMFAANWAGKNVLRLRNKMMVGTLATIVFATCCTIFFVWLSRDYGISGWWLSLSLAIHGFGQGAFASGNQTLAMLDVPVTMSGTAGGVKSMAERVSTAMGNAIISGIFFAMLPLSSYHDAALWSYAAVAAFVAIACTIAAVYMALTKD